MKRNSTSGSDRLCDAADLILRAIDSSEGMNALVEMVVVDEAAGARAERGAFTPAEFSDAMTFLVRLGIITGDDPEARSDGRGGGSRGW